MSSKNIFWDRISGPELPLETIIKEAAALCLSHEPWGFLNIQEELINRNKRQQS